MNCLISQSYLIRIGMLGYLEVDKINVSFFSSVEDFILKIKLTGIKELNVYMVLEDKPSSFIKSFNAIKKIDDFYKRWIRFNLIIPINKEVAMDFIHFLGCQEELAKKLN